MTDQTRAHAQDAKPSNREAELESEVSRLQGRLDLLAVGFGVPDGGKYIADWQVRIKKFQDIASRTPAGCSGVDRDDIAERIEDRFEEVSYGLASQIGDEILKHFKVEKR